MKETMIYKFYTIFFIQDLYPEVIRFDRSLEAWLFLAIIYATIINH